jgi:hypothetical protein
MEERVIYKTSRHVEETSRHIEKTSRRFEKNELLYLDHFASLNKMNHSVKFAFIYLHPFT